LHLPEQDKYLRSVADFRNLQERTKREVRAAKDFALQSFARDLIESIDNFDRALDAVPAARLTTTDGAEPNADLVALHGGLKMADTVLMSTLKKHGLERSDPMGQKFDPNVHDATFQTPQPDKEDGVVFHVQQKGFTLNGRVLRAAKVGVVKNS
jgi:molecular chaperone GrpE